MRGSRPATPPIERFERLYEPEPMSGYWIWMGVWDTNGYGGFFTGGPRNGPELDHLCRVRACCNFQHVEPVSRLENVRRSPIHFGAHTHCPNGHEYTPENTRRHARGFRQCIACMAQWEATTRARRRERTTA